MNPFLFTICAVGQSRCFSISQYQYHHLKQAHSRALTARTTAATARLWRSRAERAPAAPFQRLKLKRPGRRHHGRRHSFQRLLARRLDMASQQQIRRRSSAADRTTAPSSVAAAAAAASTVVSPVATHPLISTDNENLDDDDAGLANTMMMPPPPPPVGDALTPRSGRATSFASRNANRLSLTLPIAPPSSDPSRPTPTLSSTPSMPPTPLVGTPAPATPATTNDFIIAVAAQERRVLELKEELARAESDLVLLKRQWSSQETNSRRADSKRGIHARPASTTPVLADEAAGPRSSVDSDRRKSMLMQTHSTPGNNRRRVLRGGHTRTLSLLSPVMTDTGLGLREEPEQDDFRQPFRFPPQERVAAQSPVAPGLSKRSSWQPQSQFSQANVPGLVEDFRLGLKAFVEDIRQITVGDEPITGQSARSSTVVSPARASPVGQDTIRASHSSRARADNLFDSPTHSVKSAAAAAKPGAATPEKATGRKNKHFSWTPLSFDSLDDNAWANWESPASAKSTRWSGSTINSDKSQTDVSEVSETGEEDGTPSKLKMAGPDAVAFNPKLGELLPNVVNKLSPSNIKRTANHLMDEWERSLVEPSPDKENTV